MSQAIEVRKVDVARISDTVGKEHVYVAEIPNEFIEGIGFPDELEARILRDEHGKIVSIILNPISE